MNTLYKHSDIPVGAIYSYDHSAGMTNYFLKLHDNDYVHLTKDSKWPTYKAETMGIEAVRLEYKIIAPSLGAILAKVEKEVGEV